MSKYSDRIDKLERTQTNVSVASGVCWNLDQLKDEIDKHDSHNEMIKLEVVHGFEPGKKCYHWTIWYYKADWESL